MRDLFPQLRRYAQARDLAKFSLDAEAAGIAEVVARLSQS
jgi:hypothetical protein